MPPAQWPLMDSAQHQAALKQVQGRELVFVLAAPYKNAPWRIDQSARPPPQPEPDRYVDHVEQEDQMNE